VAINGLTQQLVLSIVSGICVGVAYILLGILIPKLTPEE
jgi:xanthosine utilization system XapX-like protein